ncbi:MAG: hypothetical protein JNL57_03265 [Bacteroidetes bacterium]|nr:hypothetical protein [Bacteroidota bacterium]
MFKYPILLLFIFAHAQLFSQSAADYFNKAKASAESGNKEAALEQINAAITLDPENLV